MIKKQKSSFTLIEVLVSVFLIFIIGFTLTKISSQNINTIQSSKSDFTYLYSTVINSMHGYKNINDYINIKNIPKYLYKIEKKEEDLEYSSIVVTDTFIINYNLKKESILSDENSKSFFRIK